jgi:hypothetical protein
MATNFKNPLSTVLLSHLQVTALASLIIAPTIHAGTTVVDPIAPEMVSAPAESGWWWRVAPYGWVPAVTGDVGVAYQVVPVDITMADTLEDLTFSAMLTAEAGIGHWNFGIDAVYGTFAATGGSPTPLFTGSKVKLEEFFARAHVGYDLVQDSNFTLSAFAGARYTYFSTELNLFGAAGRIRTLETSEGWIDPVVGLQAMKNLGEKWYVRFDGDIGGFGAASELIWQANLGFGYQFNECTSGILGYRGLGVDYSKGGFSVDTVAHGPFIGLVVNF